MRSKLYALFIGEFSLRRLVRSIILIPICVALGLLIVAVFFADRAIFRPPPSSYKDTADIIKLETRQGDRISARYYEAIGGAEFTVLFSHGNAEDIGMIEPTARRLRDLGLNVLTYDYPGYGTSSGRPSEPGAYAAEEAAYDFLVREKRIDPSRIILHGRSLGGGAAVDIAARRVAAGLVLESTFTTTFRVVTRYPMLPFDKFDNLEKIGRVNCPVLIIHGTGDRSIPQYHGLLLFEAAREPKQKLWVDGAGHNDVIYTNESLYLETIAQFVSSLSRK